LTNKINVLKKDKIKNSKTKARSRVFYEYLFKVKKINFFKMIEREKTYLVKFLPESLEKCEKKEFLDIYFPKDDPHPMIRIRKKGDQFEMTKKEVIDPNDYSVLKEHNIPLNEEQFNSLKDIESKKVHKIRYYYPFNGRTAEIDVFQGELKGLVLVDFEFDSKGEFDVFEMPDFCLTDVSQEEFIAGGMLCGKSYTDIEERLLKYKYKKLFIDDKSQK